MEITENYQTIEGLKKHPLFALLTSKQQKFLIAFIESNGDRHFAAKTALQAKEGRSAETASVRMLRVTGLRKLLSVYYGYEAEQSPMTRSEFTGLIAARLRKVELRDATFTRLAEIFIEQKNWKRKSDPRREEILGDVLPKESDTEPVAAAELSVDDLVRKLEEERKNGHRNPVGDEEAEQED